MSTRALVPYSTRSPDKRYENVDSLENFRGSHLEGKDRVARALGKRLDRGSSRGRLGSNNLPQKHMPWHRTSALENPHCSLNFPEPMSPPIKGKQPACPDPSR